MCLKFFTFTSTKEPSVLMYNNQSSAQPQQFNVVNLQITVPLTSDQPMSSETSILEALKSTTQMAVQAAHAT